MQLSFFWREWRAAKRPVATKACQNARPIGHSTSFNVGGTYHLFPIGIGFEADS